MHFDKCHALYLMQPIQCTQICQVWLAVDHIPGLDTFFSENDGVLLLSAFLLLRAYTPGVAIGTLSLFFFFFY